LALFKFAFALILIVIGIKMVSGKSWQDHYWDLGQGFVSSEDFVNEVVIFSPLLKSIKSENFKGGKIVAIFGGGEVDLSQVKAAEKIVNMEVVAIFGGVKIIVPKGWRANSQGTAIFGGYNSKVEPGDGETVLNIKGAAIFGGVEIVN
jgi:predicted membrane protein